MGGTPTKKRGKKKTAKGRMSMLPRMGRENVPPSSGSNGPSSGPSVGPPPASPARSVVSRASTSRRQSVLPHPSNILKTDPRPISDKVFQRKCVRELFDYLNTSVFSDHMSEKSLLKMSGRDFHSIVEFMLRKVDPTYPNSDVKNREDEIVMHFKAIGYPYTLSKAAVAAAGASHTWQNLLAALAWLVEHLKCLEADKEEDPAEVTFSEFRSLDELEKKTDKAFFQYLGDAYTSFMKGDTELSDQLTNGLVEMFERDNMVIEREIERVTGINENMAEQILQMEEEAET